MQAHGIDWQAQPLLSVQLLAMRDLETWLGTPHEKATLWHAISAAEPFIQAAMSNPDCVEDLGEEGIRKNPPVRLRFDEASVYAGLGDCLATSANKSWGDCVGVFAVEPGFPWDGQRVQYVYHAASRFNRRVEQRKYLKRRLGKGARTLVQTAMEQTKARFLKLDAEAADQLRRRLDMDPAQFWRVARGREIIELPGQWVQVELF